MIRSLYTLNRSMNILQKKLENNSANISNVKTPGYKFQTILQSTLESEDMINYQGSNKLNRKQELGDFVFGNQIDSVYRSFNEGNIYETRNATDFAVMGDGFFTVRMDNGQIAYTRNGNFKVDENNTLTTIEGYPVMGVSGAGNRQEIKINSETINVDNLGNIEGENIRFDITGFNDLDGLDSVGDTLFTGAGGFRVDNPRVEQSYLEMSNVNLANEMVKLIEVSREFESHQKFLRAADETLAKTVNEVGR